MREVVLLFGDKFVTRFMQDTGTFESYKVLMKPPLRAEVVDDWGESHIQAIKRQVEQSNYHLIAAVGEEIYYSDPTVKVVSNGTGWTMFADYLENLKNIEIGKKWSVDFAKVMKSDS